MVMAKRRWVCPCDCLLRPGRVGIGAAHPVYLGARCTLDFRLAQLGRLHAKEEVRFSFSQQKALLKARSGFHRPSGEAYAHISTLKQDLAAIAIVWLPL